MSLKLKSVVLFFKILNYPIVRIERIDNPPESCGHEVVNEMQFSDRQLHLTGHLSLSIRTSCTMAFSECVS